MAITIDYTTRIISVEKVDMTLVQSTPFEIYELDINDFRLTLKDIEDNVGGVPFVDTHNHNTIVTVGGVTLARVVEIIIFKSHCIAVDNFNHSRESYPSNRNDGVVYMSVDKRNAHNVVFYIF